MTILKGISSIVLSLIIRRNAEIGIRRGREALQTIRDNIEPIIYVNNLETYRLKFVNRSMAEMFGSEPDQLVGKLCWEVLQKDMSGLCPFCPIPKLLEEGDGAVIGWEHQNTVNGVWFWFKDSNSNGLAANRCILKRQSTLLCASDSVDAAVAMADRLMYENKKAKRAKYQSNGTEEIKW